MNKIRNNFKIIFITFVVSGIIFSTLGVYAGIIINSNTVSYNNATGLDSTNVQDAIDELYSKTTIGDALSRDILSSKSAMSKGREVLGTMPNNEAWSYTPEDIEKVFIPEGYHNGEGYIDTQGLYDKLYVEVPLQIMAKEPDKVDRKTVKAGKSVSIDCGFKTSHMTIAYRNDNTSVDRIGLGFFDFVNEKRYLYWAANPSEYQDDRGFSFNITNVTDTGFTYKSTATTDHYIIMFIYR